MEHENLKNAETLLEHVHLLIKKNDELLDATGARFNMFKVCGVNHYENTHSAIITEFLKPDGSHGMGSLFLEAFLRVKIKILETDDNSLGNDFLINTEACKVNTEVSFDNGRMDIFITDGSYAICIENKVHAGDQPEQLKRYATYLGKNYKENHWKICYLTLDGHSASENSVKDIDEYTTLAYSPHIVDWLDECIKIAAEKPMLRETLCQYRNHIKNLTGTNMEKKYMDELIDLIGRSKENYSSAKQIAGIFYMAKESILQEKIKPFLEELKIFIQEKLSDSKITLKPNISMQKETGFYFFDESWDFKICFEFEYNNYRNFYWGIWIKEDAREKMAHLADLKTEGFIPDFETGGIVQTGWIASKYVPELWCDDIVEKIMNAEQNKELLDLYKVELTKIIPIVRECIELQKSTNQT